jgi:hypothetical protein
VVCEELSIINLNSTALTSNMDFEDIMGENAEFGEGNEGSGMFNLLGMD